MEKYTTATMRLRGNGHLADDIMIKIDINSDALVKYTQKLEKMHRSALPVTVRETLNDAMFDMKKRTLPISADRKFNVRNPTFFKAMTGVSRAAGFDIRKMSATVGFNVSSNKSGSSRKSAEAAVRGLERQDVGGVGNENAIYLEASRGGSNNNLVKRSKLYNRLDPLNSRNRTFGPSSSTEKSSFVAAAYASAKLKRPFSWKSKKGGRFLIQTKSFRKTKGTAKKPSSVKFDGVRLMKSRSSAPVKIKPTHFRQEAADMTSNKIGQFYQDQFNKRVAKLLK